jgi:hypothetical protein
MKTINHVLAGLILLLMLTSCATAQPQSGDRAIKKWIAQLHDSDGAKRNAAVQALVLEPDIAAAALPLLKQELAQETDLNRRWWLQAAIQQCEDKLPQPGEISAMPDRSQGLRVNETCKSGDGPFAIVEHDRVRCWQTPKRVGNTWAYLYFVADDAFRQKVGSALVIQLEYLDAGSGEITLEYDSSKDRMPDHGAYKNHSLHIHRTDSGQWRTVRFHINDARFRGSENVGSDFRFYNGGDDLLVHSVRVWPVGAGE